MKKRTVTLAAVALAVAAVVWLKSYTADEPAAPTTSDSTRPAGSEQADMSTVLLFSDPREAEESCACAEIIRLARSVRDIPGVAFREIDTRSPGEDARRYGVRVSPSVIITGSDGVERSRFEGESRAVIEALTAAVDDLRRFSAPMTGGKAP